MFDMKDDKVISFKELINEKQSSISIEKNSKGYNWSIKLYYNEAKIISDDVIKEIKRIDDKMKNEFSGIV